jgi:Zn-dependent protease
MSIVGIFFNIMLMVLNLIPSPPLDGSRILAAFLRGKAAYHYASLERYGFIILVVLLMLGVLSKFMLPIVGQMVHFIASAFGLAI